MFDDFIPRYVPDVLFSGKTFTRHPVARVVAHPPGSHPEKCPLVPDVVAVECQLAQNGGSRWFGCQSAYIDSHLRMVIVGTNSRDEVRTAWEQVEE